MDYGQLLNQFLPILRRFGAIFLGFSRVEIILGPLWREAIVKWSKPKIHKFHHKSTVDLRPLQRGICVYANLVHAYNYSLIVYSGVLLYSVYVYMLQRGIAYARPLFKFG